MTMNKLMLQQVNPLTEDTVVKLIDQALQASPQNSIGYGLALSILIILSVVLGLHINRLHKEAKTREEAVEKFSADIMKTLIELRLRLEDTKTIKDEILAIVKEATKAQR